MTIVYKKLYGHQWHRVTYRNLSCREGGLDRSTIVFILMQTYKIFPVEDVKFVERQWMVNILSFVPLYSNLRCSTDASNILDRSWK